MKKHYLLPVLILFVSSVLFLNACKKESPVLSEPDGTKLSTGNITSSNNSIAIAPNTKEALGKLLFNDRNLSNPFGQSCGSCHDASVSFTDPLHNAIPAGAITTLFGFRNAPMASYTMFNPPFHYNADDSTYEGGLFVDGRVNSLAEQASKPFVNPLEMNNVNIGAVVVKVRNASYYALYKKIYGESKEVTPTFNNIVDAIAAYERTPELNPFTSKFDYYMKGEVKLTEQELYGLNLFNDTLRAKCGNCHLTTPDERSGKILFTDFTYNSDGVPKNPLNPYYKIPRNFNPQGKDFRDLGLGSILNDRTLDGNFRVSSLRNVAVTSPYFHNGVFTTLEQVVHFYNVRDVPGSGFKPEVADNIDTEETGNQHLTAKEEAAIVAFLKTLTDGYQK